MTTQAPASRLPGWRMRLGVACFIAAFAVYLMTFAAVASGASTATVATVATIAFILNKVFLVAAVAFLGREGFDWLKKLVFGAVRRHVFPDQVGRLRYGIGLVLFFVPIVLAWLAPYIADLAPSVGRNSVRDGLTGDLLLLVSLFILGGGFWDKLRSLFVREAKVVFPGRGGDAEAAASRR